MENQEENKKSPRQMVVEVLSKVSPESDFSDEDVLFGRILDDYNSYADLINGHEEEVRRARQEGEVAGRNTSIDQLLAEEDNGDGLPRLGGANNPDRPRASSIFDIALNYM